MLICTKEQLAKYTPFFSKKLTNIIGRTLKPNSVREILATATGYKSYPHLTSELKKHPVFLQSNYLLRDELTKLFHKKHKVTLSLDQCDDIEGTIDREPPELLFMPSVDFPFGKTPGYRSLRPEQSTPLVALQERAIMLDQWLKRDNNLQSPSIYNKHHLETDYSAEEYLSEFLAEKIEEIISDLDEDISDEEYNNRYDEHEKQWLRNNGPFYDGLSEHLKKQEVVNSVPEMDTKGCLVDTYSVPVDQLKDTALKVELTTHYSTQASLIIWQTIRANREFCVDYRRFAGRQYVGNRLVYIAVIDNGTITPLGSASSLFLDAKYLSQREALDMMDAHSAAMYDVYKETIKAIKRENLDWEAAIEEGSCNGYSAISRLWASDNALNSPNINAFMCMLLCCNFNPSINIPTEHLFECIGENNLTVTEESIYIFTEELSTQKKEDFVNILNTFTHQEYSQEDRPDLTSEELQRLEEQRNLSHRINEMVNQYGLITEAIPYDPFAHPTS